MPLANAPVFYDRVDTFILDYNCAINGGEAMKKAGKKIHGVIDIFGTAGFADGMHGELRVSQI